MIFAPLRSPATLCDAFSVGQRDVTLFQRSGDWFFFLQVALQRWLYRNTLLFESRSNDGCGGAAGT